jgi:hypothetical protein
VISLDTNVLLDAVNADCPENILSDLIQNAQFKTGLSQGSVPGRTA